MDKKITDAEIAQYVSGELSELDAERIRKAAELDKEISLKIHKMQELDRILEEDAIKNYPIPNEFLNKVKIELNSRSSEKKSESKASLISWFLKFMTTGFGGGALAGGLAIFIIFFQTPQMIFRSVDDSNLNELDKEEPDGNYNLLSEIDNNDGWNIYKSLMFRVENKQQKNSLLNGSNITVGENILINFVFFKDENRVTMSFNDLDVKDFKIYNKGDKLSIEKTIRSVDDNIFKFSIDSKWFDKSNDKELNFEKYNFELKIQKQ